MEYKKYCKIYKVIVHCFV